MKILMICPQFKPIVGGYEKAAERLSRELIQLGHDVSIITERRYTSWPSRDIDGGLTIIRHWCLYKKGMHLITSISSLILFLILHGRKFNIWHIHQYGVHCVLTIFISKLLRKPTVLKLTSSKDQGLKNATESLPLSRISTRLTRSVSAIIALTRETKLEAKEFGIPASRIHIIRNGLDTSKFKPVTDDLRRHLRNNKDIKADGTVLFVGRLSREKNPNGLIEAWSKLPFNITNRWKLIIVGSGPMESELKSIIEDLTLQESVLLAGHQTDTSHWYALSNIYIVSSHREGLSNTMMEAMASGLPVISTAVSGSMEIIHETGSGIVVNIEQGGKMQDAMKSLISNKELRSTMGSLARRISLENFNISKVAKQHIDLYSKLTSL